MINGLHPRRFLHALLPAFVVFMLIAVPRTTLAQFDNDIILSLSADGQTLSTSNWTGTAVLPGRLFSADFGDAGFPNATTNPGLNTIPSALLANRDIGLSMRRALRVWQNNNLCTVATPRLTLTRLGITITSPETDPLPADVLPSVRYGRASSSGGLHIHGPFSLQAPETSGVYVLEMQAWLGSPTTSSTPPTAPFWIVFTQNPGNDPAISTAKLDCLTFLESRITSGTSGVDFLCPCRVDLNNSGGPDVADIFAFLASWFASSPAADFNGDGAVLVSDIFAFLSAWFAGC